MTASTMRTLGTFVVSTGCLVLLSGVPSVSTTSVLSPVALTINFASALPVGMGQTVQINVTWQYIAGSPPTMPPLVAFPFVNSSQWGAQVTLSADGSTSSNGTTSVSLPIPHAGPARIVLVILKIPLSGVTVGTSLESQIESGNVLASSNEMSVPVIPRRITRLGQPDASNLLRPFKNGAAQTLFGTTVSSPIQVGLQWEPSIAASGGGVGSGVGWQMNEAVPLIGQYSAFDATVLKQHAIWMAESGISWINVDWTNVRSNVANIVLLRWSLVAVAHRFTPIHYDSLRVFASLQSTRT